jgi:hypothetical protein
MNVSEVAEVIRAAFPQIDADRIGDANKMVPPLTAAEHIAALVAMGAQEIKDVLSIEHRGSTRAHLKGKDVLILPPEMTP